VRPGAPGARDVEIRAMTISSVARTVAALVLLAAFSTGCGSGRDVTVYEPGVYKGASDPLIAKLASDDQKAKLRERFSTGQTDR
jgi:hypothetical protein